VLNKSVERHMTVEQHMSVEQSTLWWDSRRRESRRRESRRRENQRKTWLQTCQVPC
jgi:hypothetical protein